MDYQLQNLADVIRSYGRGVVFYAVDGTNAPQRWSPGTGDPLLLRHLGDTEGDIVINTNAEIATLTVPEATGPAAHEADYTGENPVIELPLYMADPALSALLSPTGTAAAGRSRRSAPREHTLVIFPEQLFLSADNEGVVTEGVLSFAGGNWELDGQPLDAARLTLLSMSFWLWRCTANRPPRRFLGGAGDARKNIETVTIQGMHHPGMPNGHHLYTIGDPTGFGIDLEGGS